MAAKKSSKSLVALILLLLIAFGGFYVYRNYFDGKVHLKDKSHTFIFIEREDTFDDVISDINAERIIEDKEKFIWLAKKMDLDKNIHPGKYRITNGMTNRQIINLIKYNKQEKIKLSFNSQIHDVDEFLEYMNNKLELSENELETVFMDDSYLASNFDLDPDNAYAAIVPGTYEVSWALSQEEFKNFLSDNYKSIWNENRKSIAKKMGYTRAQIITLASIVQGESSIRTEQQKIAGVYLNRLKKDMLLQADPTLKYANKAYDIQRVWDSHKAIDSPYNTYKYKGLPPAPISLVSTQAIDAVLNYTKHKFIFFCAKPSLNGYSDFSESYAEHEKYAKAYRKEMEKRGIR
jgi:UPF0755 protein